MENIDELLIRGNFAAAAKMAGKTLPPKDVVAMLRKAAAHIVDVARALHSPDGVGLSIEHTARVLMDAYSNDVGYHHGKVAAALISREGANVSFAEATKALAGHYGMNLDYSEVAKALSYCGRDEVDICRILADPKGLRLRDVDIVDALREGLGLSAEEATQALAAAGIEREQGRRPTRPRDQGLEL